MWRRCERALRDQGIPIPLSEDEWDNDLSNEKALLNLAFSNDAKCPSFNTSAFSAI
jgi:hypothetical protein